MYNDYLKHTKPFDLEEAKKPETKVITRSGKAARILCFDRIDTFTHGSILALVCNEKKTWERPVYYNEQGIQISGDASLDLLIKQND